VPIPVAAFPVARRPIAAAELPIVPPVPCERPRLPLVVSAAFAATFARVRAGASHAIADQPLLEARALLVARHRVLRARIGVVAAGPPVASAGRSGLPPVLRGGKRGLRRVPEAAAFEPLEARIRLRALQLLQRRQQIFGMPRAEGRRQRAGDDHPAREWLGHEISPAPAASASR
jgi:hypothetical protein